MALMHALGILLNGESAVSPKQCGFKLLNRYLKST